MARTGQMCGAVNGALLVIGLAHGSTAADDAAGKEKTYAVTRGFWSRFKERHGSLLCRELLGVDIGTPAGREVAMRSGLFKTRCPMFVRDAAEIVEQLL
jgi:C_GCAxxG_C_C family probable redox protein